MILSLTSTRTGSQKLTLNGAAHATTFTIRLAELTALSATGHTKKVTVEPGGEILRCAAASRRRRSSGAKNVVGMARDFVALNAPLAVVQLS